MKGEGKRDLPLLLSMARSSGEIIKNIKEILKVLNEENNINYRITSSKKESGKYTIYLGHTEIITDIPSRCEKRVLSIKKNLKVKHEIDGAFLKVVVPNVEKPIKAGQKVGDLTVIKRVPIVKNNKNIISNVRFLCKCERCGNNVVYSDIKLRTGKYYACMECIVKDKHKEKRV